MNILNLNSEIESLFDSKEEKKKEMLPIQKGQKKIYLTYVHININDFIFDLFLLVNIKNDVFLYTYIRAGRPIQFSTRFIGTGSIFEPVY